MAKDPKNRETAAIILQAMKDRRSIRNYTGEAIPKEDLELIVEAGLTSASGHADYPWDIVVVQHLGRRLLHRPHQHAPPGGRHGLRKLLDPDPHAS